MRKPGVAHPVLVCYAHLWTSQFHDDAMAYEVATPKELGYLIAATFVAPDVSAASIRLELKLDRSTNFDQYCTEPTILQVNKGLCIIHDTDTT